MKRIVFCALFFSATIQCTYAQRFGGTPPEIKWRQINTDTARIIYPEGIDSLAKRIAQVLHAQAAGNAFSLGEKVRKINIVLQGQTAISNGYVGLGPYRSEFLLTPDPDNFSNGSVGWADQLTLHEYRHVQQYNNFERGLSRTMRILFGQEGYALASNASIPNWFFEGDAVHTETVLTDQGRGRLPQFLSRFPALWKAEKTYSWMKLRNGSMKDWVPSHYHLGYQLVNYGYEKYGADFWKKVTQDAASFRPLLYPFQGAVKKHSGETFRKFVENSFEHQKEKARNLSAGQSTQPHGAHNIFPVNEKVVTHHLYPYSTEDGAIVYLKKANNRRPVFMLADSTGERWLRVRDITLQDQFSYRNGKIVYAAYESDPRWYWRDYSVIRLMDVGSRTQKTITSKSKYFSPDISESGDKIVAVQNESNGTSQLHILDAETGEVIKKLQHLDIATYTDPRFASETEIVSALRTANGQMGLGKINWNTGALEWLVPASYNVTGNPFVKDNVVYFTASFGGLDNIFKVALTGGVVEELNTQWELGNYQVNVGNNKITWTALTAEGYQLQQMDISAAQWKPVEEILTKRLAISYPVGQANAVSELLNNKLPSRNFESKPYSKSTGLFNFHSWRPYYEDPEFTFSIYGQNILNTLETQLYYSYNENERTNAAGISAVYGKWFTHLNVGSVYTFGRQQQIGQRIRQWDQWDTRIGLSVPLSWVKKLSYKSFNIGSNIYFAQENNKAFYKDSLGSTQFMYLHSYVSLSEQVESAIQHIYPRLGYALTLQYRNALTKYNSRQFLATASVYLPGLAPTHSIVLHGAWQETGVQDVRFANRFPYSRGYNAPYFARIYGLRSNYHFPIAYPDFGFGNILYIKRLRGNVFYDAAKVFDARKQPIDYQNSAGGELFFDTKWWNQYELTFGLRVSRLLNRDYFTGETGATRFEFIMPVSIFPR